MWPSRAERLSDESLLSAVGLGDAHAATVFVRRFQRRVYGLAVTITFDAAAAEDVAQQAFERAWRHAAAYDARRGRVDTWLLTITRNLAIDVVRGRRPRPLDPDSVGELLGSLDADPADDAVRSAQLEQVVRALDDLPDLQRRAVLLATVASRTSAEIAAIEGVPVPTAKHRVQSGLRKLRDAVRAEAER